MDNGKTNDLNFIFQTGDIILSHERGKYSSRSIALLTGSYFSHSALYLENKVVIESVGSEGVRYGSLDDTFSKCDYVVMRYLHLTDEQRGRIMEISPEYIGGYYDFGGAINIFKRIYLKSRNRPLHNPNATICTNLLIDIYRRIGVELVPMSNPLPKDLFNASSLQRVY